MAEAHEDLVQLVSPKEFLTRSGGEGIGKEKERANERAEERSNERAN
jgi:hypothetical protein